MTKTYVTDIMRSHTTTNIIMTTSVSGPGKIRQLNRSAVLSHIRFNGRNSRLKIGKELELSAAAITSVVSELVEEGLLRKFEPTSDDKIAQTQGKSQGRPSTTLELNPNFACVYGLLLRPVGNVCYIEAAWADYTGAVHISETIIKSATDNYQSILSGIKQAISELQTLIPYSKKKQIPNYGLAIGIPGVVENNTIPIAPKLPCIADPNFAKELEASFNFPISLENDVNLGALSELHHQPRLRALSFAYLHIYYGVGSSIVIENKMLKGSRGWSGEIGQLDVKYSKDSRPSFEQLLNVDGVLADLLESLGHPRDALDQLIPYIENNNTAVIDVLEQYSHQLFDAINVLHSVLDLDEIIIAFPSALLLKKLLPKINQLVDNMPHTLKVSTPVIENHQASLHGAALCSLNVALETIEKRHTKK